MMDDVKELTNLFAGWDWEAWAGLIAIILVVVCGSVNAILAGSIVRTKPGVD